ncbi:MAG: polysaccharide biosynthesis/export family protein [Bacteroidia bacterium]
MEIKHFRIILLLLIAGSFLMSGCVSNRKIVYLQAKGDEKGKTTYVNPHQQNSYIIRANDMLFVQLSSLYEETNDILKRVYQNRTGTGVAFSDAQFYMNGYTVDREGYIELPLFGKYFVDGKSVEELEKELQDSISQQYKGAFVTVRIPGTRVTILGEVRLPGQYTFFKEQVSIFDAIAETGDLLETARRKKVKLLRTTGDTITVHTLDLTKREFLSSEFFYIRADDIIYVEPMTITRIIGSRTSGFTIALTVLSFTTPILLFYNILNNN